MARKKSTKQKQKQSQRQSVNVVVHLPETKRRKGRKRTRRPKESEPSSSFQPGFASLSPIVYQQILPYPQMNLPESTPAFRAEVKRPILEEMGVKIPPPMTAEQKKQITELRATLRDEMKKLAEDMASAKPSTAVLEETFPSQTIRETPLENPVYTPGEPLVSKKRRPTNPIEEAGLPLAFQAEPTDIGVFPLLETQGALSAVRKEDIEAPAFIPGRKRLGAEPKKASKPKWDSTENLNRIYRKITGVIPSDNTKASSLLRDIYTELTGETPSMDPKKLREVVKDMIKEQKL